MVRGKLVYPSIYQVRVRCRLSSLLLLPKLGGGCTSNRCLVSAVSLLLACTPYLPPGHDERLHSILHPRSRCYLDASPLLFRDEAAWAGCLTRPFASSSYLDTSVVSESHFLPVFADLFHNAAGLGSENILLHHFFYQRFFQ